MFCDVCKREMDESKTELVLPGKESEVKVTNVPCAVCPCGTRVVDDITLSVAKKGASKCKEATLDFDNMGSLGIMIGKIKG